jgi:hypothetical protein
MQSNKNLSQIYLFLSILTIGVLHTRDFLYVPTPFELLLCFDFILHNCNKSYLCSLQPKKDVSANLLNAPTIYS